MQRTKLIKYSFSLWSVSLSCLQHTAIMQPLFWLQGQDSWYTRHCNNAIRCSFVPKSIKHISFSLRSRYGSRSFRFLVHHSVSPLPSMSCAINIAGVERKKQQRFKATSAPPIITSICSHTQSCFHAVPSPKPCRVGLRNQTAALVWWGWWSD